MTGLDLFTGYGGISLALKNYVEPIAYVEIEKYAQKIIASRMADGSLRRAPILSDVRNVRGEFGVCEIIYGGFPCQDISVAGIGKGLGGERSGLFFEIIRLTKEIRPAFVFLENVPAIRTRGLDQVIKAFSEIRYDCRWICLSAASVGAPHKRERWFLLAHADGELLRVERQRDSQGKTDFKKESKLDGGYRSLADSASAGFQIGGSPGFTAGPTEKFSRVEPQFERCSSIIPDAQGERSGPGARESSGSREQDNFMRKTWWKTEPNVGRVVDGSAFRVDRIKALGNGVVPLQVKTAFEILMGLQ